MDSTGTGIQAVGIVGQFDDAATGAVTENQFAPVRISTRRALLVEGVASGTAVPVSSSTFATAAKQDTIIGHLDGVEGLLTTIDGDTSNLSVVGGGTEATAIRITVASDSTGVLSVDDNGSTLSIDDGGGAITVDGTVAVTNADMATIAGAIRAEDAASAGGHTGIVVMARRTDTPAAQSGTDGDYEFIQVVGGRLAATTTVTGTVTVDGSGVTQPVSHAALTELAAAIDTEVQVDVVGSLPAGDNNIGNVDLASSIPAGTNNIGDVDVLSIVPGTGATNLGKAEDAAHSSGDVGVMALGVRQSSQADFGADGDYVPFSVDDDGGLRVSIVAGAGSGGTASADDADFTAGTTSGTPAMGVYESTPTNVTDGDLGTIGITEDRRLKTSAVVTGTVAVTQSGTWDEVGINDSGNSITVDNAALSVVGGGVEASALRVTIANDSTGVLSVDDNGGNLSIDDGGNSITVDNGGTFAVQATLAAGATTVAKAEDAAHSSGDVGIPPLGVRVDSPNATVAADGDYHYIAVDKVGGIRVALQETDFAVLGTNHVKKYYTSTGAVTDGIVWSPAAGKRWYVTDIIINVSAACTVTFEDDKAGGDEAVAKFEFAANSGMAHSFNTPWFSGEDAADLLVTTSAGNIYITVVGYEI